MKALTVEEFKEALPSGMKKSINPLLIMRVNNVLDNPEEWETYKENLLSFTTVLQQGKFKMEQYVHAVRYVGFKVMGMTNKEAHRRTFPEKHQQWALDGIAAKDIASYTTAYNKSKLVNLLFEQTLIPTYILNAPMFQRALNVQAEIMLDEDVSPKVRSDAANSLLTHLKAPEIKKVELDIGPAYSNVIEDYQTMMGKMVEAQMDLIKKGGDVKQITNAPVRVPEGEVVDGEVIG